MQIVDFKPCKLHRGADTYIFYSLLFEGNPEFERVRVRLNHIAKKEVGRYALNRMAEINELLYEYKDPRKVKASHKQKITLKEAINNYITICTNKKLRPDTLKDYKSQTGALLQFVTDHCRGVVYLDEFTDKHAFAFFDHLINTENKFGKINGEYTYNTYNTNLRTMFNFFIKRDLCAKNPIKAIEYLEPEEKERIYIDVATRLRIRDYFRQICPHFWVLCCLQYYCFIRRTETTRLKLNMINWQKGLIELPGRTAKTRKRRIVVMPDEFISLLKELKYENYPQHFHFAGNNLKFEPAAEPAKPKSISDFFRRHKKRLKLADNVQMYGFKDTGITDFIETNGSLKIAASQSGHTSTSITEKYYHSTPDAIDNMRKFVMKK